MTEEIPNPLQEERDRYYNLLVRLMLRLEETVDRFTTEPSLPKISLKDLCSKETISWWRSEKKNATDQFLAKREAVRARRNLTNIRKKLTKEELKALDDEYARKAVLSQ